MCVCVSHTSYKLFDVTRHRTPWHLNEQNDKVHVQPPPYCFWHMLVNFGCSLQLPGSFKKYWCLGHTPWDSELIGLGSGLSIKIYRPSPGEQWGWKPLIWTHAVQCGSHWPRAAPSTWNVLVWTECKCKYIHQILKT